jgi:glycosyltransferase involved in cell wall biosynthesis
VWGFVGKISAAGVVDRQALEMSARSSTIGRLRRLHIGGEASVARSEHTMSDDLRTRTASEPDRQRKLALVLWRGDVGGAEVLNAKLAEHLRQLGADVTIVFVGTPWPLAERLSRTDIPYCSLGFGRGRNVLRHPRQYATAITRIGTDGALLVNRGYMAAALRAGGYRGPIIAVEHGSLLFDTQGRFTPRRLLQQIGRVTGAWTADAEIAVSDFMLDRMRQYAHADLTGRIYNGIDLGVYRPAVASVPDRAPNLVVGFAGRLVAGKGADHLIRAIEEVGRRIPAKLLIAGDGPERSRLESQAQELGVASKVEFLGVVDDMPSFWRQCDIAAIPSDTWVESFSMVTLEAMSCGKAIVASRAGAIPELIVDGTTGTLVTPGDVSALAGALVFYAEHPELRNKHGLAARARAVERFHIEACARAYLDLFAELVTKRYARALPL